MAGQLVAASADSASAGPPPVSRAAPAKALGKALRAGRHDGGPRLHQALCARAIQAVGITGPDVLRPAELGKAM